MNIYNVVHLTLLFFKNDNYLHQGVYDIYILQTNMVQG